MTSTLSMLCMWCCGVPKYYEALVSSLPQETLAKLIFNIKEPTLVHYSTRWEQREQRETPRENAMSRIYCLYINTNTLAESQNYIQQLYFATLDFRSALLLTFLWS